MGYHVQRLEAYDWGNCAFAGQGYTESSSRSDLLWFMVAAAVAAMQLGDGLQELHNQLGKTKTYAALFCSKASIVGQKPKSMQLYALLTGSLLPWKAIDVDAREMDGFGGRVSVSREPLRRQTIGVSVRAESEVAAGRTWSMAVVGSLHQIV